MSTIKALTKFAVASLLAVAITEAASTPTNLKGNIFLPGNKCPTMAAKDGYDVSECKLGKPACTVKCAKSYVSTSVVPVTAYLCKSTKEWVLSTPLIDCRLDLCKAGAPGQLVCQNGGQCGFSSADNKFKCFCKQGWGGNLCETYLFCGPGTAWDNTAKLCTVNGTAVCPADTNTWTSSPPVCNSKLRSCGTGTVVSGTSCVRDPSLPTQCGTNTAADASGVCQVTAGACSQPATTFSSGVCVISSGACGTNAVLSGGVCVADPSLPTACSTGTVKSNGVCVVDPSLPTACDTGTVLSNGVCVVDPTLPTACSTGTVLSNGVCVVDPTLPTACSTGTVLSNGVCVVDPSLPTACDTGTTLDATSNKCVPTSAVCGTGLFWDSVNKQCVAECASSCVPQQAGDINCTC